MNECARRRPLNGSNRVLDSNTALGVSTSTVCPESSADQRGLARRHFELEKVRLLVLQADLSVCPPAHERAGADLKFQVPGRSRIELIAGGEGRIDLALNPFLCPGPPERDLSVHETQPRRRRADRVLLLVRRLRRVSGGAPVNRLTASMSPRIVLPCIPNPPVLCAVLAAHACSEGASSARTTFPVLPQR
jgi:hypothetical protein